MDSRWRESFYFCDKMRAKQLADVRGNICIFNRLNMAGSQQFKGIDLGVGWQLRFACSCEINALSLYEGIYTSINLRIFGGTDESFMAEVKSHVLKM